MKGEDLTGILEFLRSAEQLKDTTRTAWTSEGRRESVAAHTWRLCLMALVMRRHFPDVDATRLLEMCIIHDLGEAIGGDIPAVDQPPEGKAQAERRDLVALLEPLPEPDRHRIVELWDEYEAARSAEAKLAKALDKLETIMQHNQGSNPSGFDYAFNLEYGRRFTSEPPLVARIRAILDRETARLSSESEVNDAPTER